MALEFPVDRSFSAPDALATAEHDKDCMVLDKQRDLQIPCVRYKGLDYRFTLHPLINPIDPLKTIWKMDPRSLGHSSDENCVDMGDDKRLKLPCVSFRGARSDLVLNYHENPSDPLGHYWMNEPDDLRGGSAALWYPEIYIVNDYARFKMKELNTETDTADLLNLVNLYFSQSTNLVANNLQLILVDQRTLTKVAEDLPHMMKGPEVDPVALLQDFSAWLENKSNNVPAHDAAILLTSLDLEGPTTEIAYMAQMCNSSRAVAVVQATFTPAFDGASIARVIGRLVGMCTDPPGKRDPLSCPTLPANLATRDACLGRIMAATTSPNAVPTSFSACSAFDFNDWLVNRSPRPNCLSQAESARTR
jgi:hypothetical protein